MVTKKTSKSPSSKAASAKTAASQAASVMGKGNRTALVTGASSGIGEALARGLAAAGYDLILVARSADKLRQLSQELADAFGTKAQVAAADLTQSNAVQNLVALLQRQQVNVHVLVNCAGVLEQGAFASMEARKLQQMIDLNITALTLMLSAFVPRLVQAVQTDGHTRRILNVASIAAFQPIPMLATYAASKAYVLSLSESLSEELKGQGVTVTALCPGVTATPMLAMAADANGKLSKLPGFLIADVTEVAKTALAAMLRGDAICVPGAVNQLGMVGSRATPKWLVRKIGGLLGRRAL